MRLKKKLLLAAVTVLALAFGLFSGTTAYAWFMSGMANSERVSQTDSVRLEPDNSAVELTMDAVSLRPGARYSDIATFINRSGVPIFLKVTFEVDGYLKMDDVLSDAQDYEVLTATEVRIDRSTPVLPRAKKISARSFLEDALKLRAEDPEIAALTDVEMIDEYVSEHLMEKDDSLYLRVDADTTALKDRLGIGAEHFYKLTEAFAADVAVKTPEALTDVMRLNGKDTPIYYPESGGDSFYMLLPEGVDLELPLTAEIPADLGGGQETDTLYGPMSNEAGDAFKDTRLNEHNSMFQVTVNVFAIQATENAIRDVFGDEISEDSNFAQAFSDLLTD